MPTGVGLSNTFNPGIASAKAAGVNAVVGVYQGGDAGIEQSCQTIAEKIKLGSQDPRVLAWGDKALQAARIDGRDQPTDIKKASALLDAFRAQTVYRADPPNTEYIQSAATTLCLADGLCVVGGDCDDMVVALGSVLLAQSIPTRVVKQSFGAQYQQHVLLVIQSGGAWYYLDPSTREAPTTVSRAVDEVWIDPLDFKGTTGTGSAEIVTLGRPFSMLGLGDALAVTTVTAGPGPYGQAAADLQNEVISVIGAGDVYAKGGDRAGAIQAYMAAGQAGATSVGPEIDLAGAANVTGPLTQQAWTVNGTLQTQGAAARAKTGGPTDGDVATARAQVVQMAILYEQAIGAGSAKPNTVKGPGAVGGVNPLVPVAIVALVGGVTWAVLRGRKRRR